MLRRERTATFKAASYFLTASDITGCHRISLLVYRLFPSQGWGSGQAVSLLNASMDLPLRKRRSKRVRMAAIPKRNRTKGIYKYFFMLDFIIIYQYLFNLLI